MPEAKGLLVVPCGFRSDGTLRALEITDEDTLKIALQGYYSGAWINAPPPWGFSSELLEYAQVNSTGETYTYNDFGPVPSDEVWAVQCLMCYHNDDANRWIDISILHGDTTVEFDQNTALAQYVRHFWSGEVVVAPGATVRFRISYQASGKYIRAGIIGYRQSLAT